MEEKKNINYVRTVNQFIYRQKITAVNIAMKRAL